MFNFSNTIQFQDKINDVFTIGEILVDMISDDYDTNFRATNPLQIVLPNALTDYDRHY